MIELPVPAGASVIRRFFGRMGAVARIGAVSSTTSPPNVDPARRTDPRWSEFPRPDASAIPIADLNQFRDLVYGADLWRDRDVSPAGVTMSQADAGESFTPADRIVGTLRHLRGIYGL